MVGQAKLQTLQYNVLKSREVVLATLCQHSEVVEYDALAIQKPWDNPR